jgi:hypothetical protein
MLSLPAPIGRDVGTATGFSYDLETRESLSNPLDPKEELMRGVCRTLAAAVFLTAGCATDYLPTEPDLAPIRAQQAFLLTIDVATGEITIHGPSTYARGGASYSLLGDEAVGLRTTNCSWSDLSKKIRRCSFDLAIENLLSSVDLVTPTTFPRPPHASDGTPLSGIFVFPFAAAALGVTGGSATPSPDWDNPPANFFNDFAGCQGGKTSDCYPSKTFPSPLEAGRMTDYLRVGFDVDRSAHSVSVYVVVAADLSDRGGLAPGLYQSVLEPDECSVTGAHESPGLPEPQYSVFPQSPLTVGKSRTSSQGDGATTTETRTFCAFTLPTEIANTEILSANLRLYQESATSGAYDLLTDVIAESVDYGDVLEGADFFLPALQTLPNPFSTNDVIEYKSANALQAVLGDLAAARTRSQFRLRFSGSISSENGSGSVTFSNNESSNPPQLVIVYAIE